MLRDQRIRLWARRGLRQALWIGSLVLLWQLAIVISGAHGALYPPPGAVVSTAIGDGSDGLLAADIFASLWRVLLGFTIGSAAGLLCGVATSRTTTIRDTLGLTLDLLRPVPPIALVPLVVLWFGLGELPKIALVVIGVMPPVWITTHLGLEGVDRTYILTARSLGIQGRRLIVEVLLPAALPTILAGLRTALGIAFYCLVAAEMAGAVNGVAYRIEISNAYFRVDRMIEYLVVLGALFVLLQQAFVVSASWLFPWASLNTISHEV